MKARQWVTKRWWRWLAITPAFAALLLSACGLPGTGQTPSADTVLADVQAANIKDMTFSATGSLTVNLGALAGSSGSSATNFNINGDVSGKITSSPQRADIVITASGTQEAEIITDASSQQAYITSPLIGTILGALGGSGGSSSSSCVGLPVGSASSVLDTSVFTNFEHITNAKNIGSDTVNGVSVWHLQGNQQYAGATVTEDFYVDKSTSYPVRVVISANAGTGSTSGGSSPSGSATITIDITHVNSGISISLPTNCQTLSGLGG